MHPVRWSQFINLSPGFSEKQIDVKVIEGSENAANDILKETRNDDCGMMMGRRGVSSIREYFLEYPAIKISYPPIGSAIWIV